MAPDHCLWTVSYQTKLFVFFPVKMFRAFSFPQITYLNVPHPNGSLNLCWLCIGVGSGVPQRDVVALIFPLGYRHIVERIGIGMHSWADRIKCVSFFWRTCISYMHFLFSGLCIGWTLIHLSFLSVPLFAKMSPTSSEAAAYKPINYIKWPCFVFHHCF